MRKVNCAFILLGFIIFSQCKLEPFVEGKLLYSAYCANCHMEDGSGLKEIYPPLNINTASNLTDISLACMIRNGPARNKEYTGAAMPAFPKLSEIEISNIVNYVETHFYERSSIDINVIRNELKACSGNE